MHKNQCITRLDLYQCYTDCRLVLRFLDSEKDLKVKLHIFVRTIISEWNSQRNIGWIPSEPNDL